MIDPTGYAVRLGRQAESGKESVYRSKMKIQKGRPRYLVRNAPSFGQAPVRLFPPWSRLPAVPPTEQIELEIFSTS